MHSQLNEELKFTQAEQKYNKQKLIRRVIILCLCIIPLFIWIQSHLLTADETSPFGSNILIFALINLNVLLVLFVLFLVLRNLAELLFERRINKIGRTLKTKLIASFLSLTLIPTILLFFVALQFVSTSMDYWFNANIENSLEQSLKLAQSLLKERESQAILISKTIEGNLETVEVSSYTPEVINETLINILTLNTFNGPDSLSLISKENNIEVVVQAPNLQGVSLPKIPTSIIEKVQKQHSRETVTQETKEGDLVRCVAEIQYGTDKNNRLILITSLLVKTEQLNQMTAISRGIEGYRQLKYFKEPFKLN